MRGIYGRERIVRVGNQVLLLFPASNVQILRFSGYRKIVTLVEGAFPATIRIDKILFGKRTH